jgi:GWxTD domain-containing protein
MVFSSLLLLAGSCVTVYDTISNRNFAHQYNPGQAVLNPEFKIYRVAADEYRLYVRLFPGEFTYGTHKNDTLPHASVSLFYRITENYESVEILDSLTHNLRFANRKMPQFITFLPLKPLSPGRYVMEVFVSDRIGAEVISKVIELDIESAGTDYDLFLLSAKGSPKFQSFVSTTDTLRIRCERWKNSPLQLTRYALDTALPAAPDDVFAANDLQAIADSSWTVSRHDTVVWSFSEPGIYHFSGGNELQGSKLLCGPDFYPEVKTARQLLRSLAYLATPQEMANLWKLNNPKVALDTFWLACTKGNANDARELIRVYYNRLQLANYYFGGSKEGFLSDRGMLYLILGAPNAVRKTNKGEYWNYGRSAKDGLEFYFYRKSHPVFGNSYYLERKDSYSRVWKEAIKSWREGSVFSLNY